jgi:diguanylate cyclase
VTHEIDCMPGPAGSEQERYMAETALHETGQRRSTTSSPDGSASAARPGIGLLLTAVPPSGHGAAHVLPGIAPEIQLARAWLIALAVNDEEGTLDCGEVPMELATARRCLTELSNALVCVVLDMPFRPRQAADIGAALVSADFVGPNVLGRSLRVLILRLPALLRGNLPDVCLPDDLDHRIGAVTDALANGYVRALRDRAVAEREATLHAQLDAQRCLTERLRHQATHDALTGLPNRVAVFGRLAEALAAGGGGQVGLCYLDLDGFKGINDRYGHNAGDHLLVAVAERIGQVARDHGAFPARIGGDEFLILAERSPGITGLIGLASAMLAEVSRPVSLRTSPVSVTACTGIAEHAVGTPRAAMVDDADTALYRAKSLGPGRWAVCDSAHEQAS